jgi:hypothetical protein
MHAQLLFRKVDREGGRERERERERRDEERRKESGWKWKVKWLGDSALLLTDCSEVNWNERVSAWSREKWFQEGN